MTVIYIALSFLSLLHRQVSSGNVCEIEIDINAFMFTVAVLAYRDQLNSLLLLE